MKTILLVYFSLGVAWFVWAKSKGYANKWTDLFVWPIKAYQQVRDLNSVAE